MSGRAGEEPTPEELARATEDRRERRERSRHVAEAWARSRGYLPPVEEQQPTGQPRGRRGRFRAA